MSFTGTLVSSELGTAQLGALGLGQDEPIITTTGIVGVPAGSVVATGTTCTVRVIVTPASGHAVVTGYQCYTTTIFTAGLGGVLLSGFAPTVTIYGVNVACVLPYKSIRIRGKAPSLVEFGKGLTLYVDGSDKTQYLVIANTFQIQSQTLGRWSATFDLYDDSGTFSPSLDHTVRISDYGQTIFSGVFSQIVTDRYMSTERNTVYHCTAVDRSSLCDHRLVSRTYKATDWPDVSNVVIDIVNNNLDGEGITAVGLPLFGGLDADLTFNFCTVTSALDEIANMTGCVWWIDPTSETGSNLRFSSFDELPASPFNLTESSRNWRNLTVTTTTANYYNRLYAVGNRYVPPASGGGEGETVSVSETFRWAVGAAGVFTQGGSPYPAYIKTSLPVGSIVSMTVDGFEQTTDDFNNWVSRTTLKNSHDALWVFGSGNTQVSPTYPPNIDATVVITYNKWVPASSGATTTGLTSVSLAATTDPLSGTLGSGIFEGTIQVDDFTTLDDLNNCAQAELARINGVPYIVAYETDAPGIQPGQMQNCNIPLSGIADKNVMITQVTGTYFPVDLGTATGGVLSGSFRWQVEGRSNLDPGNWVKWFERLTRRTQNSLPIPDFEEATFVLGAGDGNVSTGVNITNAYIASRSGAMFEILCAAGTPPTTASLTFQVTCMHDGSSTPFNLCAITMPPGLSPNQLIKKEYSPALVINKNDVLNVSTSWSSLGDSASNCTLKLRWQAPSSNL